MCASCAICGILSAMCCFKVSDISEKPQKTIKKQRSSVLVFLVLALQGKRLTIYIECAR